MEGPLRLTVAVSAVNIRKAGTLEILRATLEHLSALSGEYRVVALVHDRRLCEYPGIEYIEMPDCINGWLKRLKAEYFTMHRISRELARQDGGRKVWTWLSLHDTTPRVEAEHREVYCHNAFPFMKLKAQDFVMDPKIGLLVLFSRLLYRINVHSNDCLIVQQEWFADAMSQMLGVERSRFRVIPPVNSVPVAPPEECSGSRIPTFLFVSTPDCHKNFETLCEASRRLSSELGPGKFRTIITVKGDENRYARYLRSRWGACPDIDFLGAVPRTGLPALYASADCLVFPSRIESWGLPISEYAAVHPGGRMILSDLPYAHATAGDADAWYFPPTDAAALVTLMKKHIKQ